VKGLEIAASSSLVPRSWCQPFQQFNTEDSLVHFASSAFVSRLGYGVKCTQSRLASAFSSWRIRDSARSVKSNKLELEMRGACEDDVLYGGVVGNVYFLQWTLSTMLVLIFAADAWYKLRTGLTMHPWYLP